MYTLKFCEVQSLCCMIYKKKSENKEGKIYFIELTKDVYLTKVT